MAKVKMTVQEALNRRKTLQNRVDNMFTDPDDYFTYSDGTHPVTDEQLDNMKANFQSLIHLYDNLENLKVAINHSNAVTKITVAGKEMTCADAIAKHNAADKTLRVYRTILESYTAAESRVDAKNHLALSQEKIDAHISAVCSSQAKTNPTLVEELTKTFIALHTTKMYDPAKVKETLTKKINELTEFEEAVHTQLTISNVSTEIEVEFND